MKLKYIIAFIMLTVPLIGVCQQNIRGNISATDKEPLVGATVQILNTSNGTITDLEGNFELPFVPREADIVFSYVGYLSDTVSAQFNSSMNIVLKEDSGQLSEVVIKGNSSTIDEMQPILNELISEKELLKAACCNLSESFETNASVDVSITDAVSGAKMIRMLGLDGRYVLISREGIPHIRGLNSK